MIGNSNVQEWAEGLRADSPPPESNANIVALKRKHDEMVDRPRRRRTNGDGDGEGLGDGDGDGESDITALSSRLTLKPSGASSRAGSPTRSMADLALANPPISQHQIGLGGAQPPDSVRLLRREVVRYRKCAGVIPSCLKDLLRDEQPPQSSYDSSGQPSQDQQKAEGLLLEGLLRILNQAKECREDEKPGPSWGEEVVRPLLELATGYWRRKRKTNGIDICIENITTASISMPQLLPRDHLGRPYLPKRTDYGMYLKCQDRVRRRIQLLRSEEWTINQSLAPYLRNKPQVMILELKKVIPDSDPLIQLAIWSFALLNRLKLLLPDTSTVLCPVVALQVVGHEWSIYYVYHDETGAVKLYGPENIGSTLEIEGIFHILRVLGVIADYATDVYWPWLDKNILTS
ncbi:MAG: hypothetical protein M1839_004583 [Geoglossum umbratile]|nr:MAG: hypothetical protein M1839_004583 [Geoglossum umbratile]